MFERKTLEQGGYTGRAWVGHNYRKTKNLPTKEIAKLIRADIAALVKSRAIPKGKYAVRTERFAGGSSITVTIRDFEYPVLNADHVIWNQENGHIRPPVGHSAENRYEPPARLAIDKVTEVLNSYRYDDSDSMIDYFSTNFYAHVYFSNILEEYERKAILNERLP